MLVSLMVGQGLGTGSYCRLRLIWLYQQDFTGKDVISEVSTLPTGYRPMLTFCHARMASRNLEAGWPRPLVIVGGLVDWFLQPACQFYESGLAAQDHGLPSRNILL
jgi:hypothetical protein